MAQSTGVILAIGGITLANESLFHDQPVDWRIPAATGIAAGVFALMEHSFLGVWAPRLAWLALATVLLTRVNPNVPSPTESALAWYQGSAGKQK